MAGLKVFLDSQRMQLRCVGFHIFLPSHVLLASKDPNEKSSITHDNVSTNVISLKHKSWSEVFEFIDKVVSSWPTEASGHSYWKEECLQWHCVSELKMPHETRRKDGIATAEQPLWTTSNPTTTSTSTPPEKPVKPSSSSPATIAAERRRTQTDLSKQNRKCDWQLAPCMIKEYEGSRVRSFWWFPNPAAGAYVCFLSNPQNLDIGGLIASPQESPFAKCLDIWLNKVVTRVAKSWE